MIQMGGWFVLSFKEAGGRGCRKMGRPGSTKVCIECIGQSAKFVCSSRTRERVRLAHTNFTDCPLQSTQHYLCESPVLFYSRPWARRTRVRARKSEDGRCGGGYGGLLLLVKTFTNFCDKKIMVEIRGGAGYTVGEAWCVVRWVEFDSWFLMLRCRMAAG